METGKKLLVSAIKNGTVIDHIPAEELFKVIKILNLDKISNPITIGNNLDSKKLGKKAIIKISEIFLDEEDINKISLIAKNANTVVIKDYKIVEKTKVKVPKRVVGLAQCVNPKCITNHENIVTKFSVIEGDEVSLKCEYCEKITTKKHFSILKK